MSVLAREAQRRRIRQIMQLIDTEIRPAMERDIAQTKARAASTLDSIQSQSGPKTGASSASDGMERTIEGWTVEQGCPSSATPEAKAGTPSTMTTRHEAAIFADRNAQLTTSDSYSTTMNSEQTGPDLFCGQQVAGESNQSIEVDIPRDTIAAKKTHPMFSAKYTENDHTNKTTRDVPLYRDPSAEIATSLQYLRSGHTPPIGVFEGATSNDLSVLDAFYQTLGRMTQEIDKRLADIFDTASERFDRHMASQEGDSALQIRPRRRFKGQEEWQTGKAKKTHWNADADWGSDTAWSEVETEAEIEQESIKKGGGSKLRYSYIPGEWSWSPPEFLSGEVEDPFEW